MFLCSAATTNYSTHQPSTSSYSSTPTHSDSTTPIHQSHLRPPQPSQSAASTPQAGTRATDDIRQPVGETAVSREDIRLDRTPTDEEINWLWQRVRTCLNTSRSTTSPNNPTNPKHNSPTSPSSSNNPTNPNVTYHYKLPSTSTTSVSYPAKPTGTNSAYNKTNTSGSSVASAVGKPTPASQTYVDGMTRTPGPPVKDRRPHASATYTNNYMGTALPARRRLVTMDTLGRLVQRRLPQRPMSGVEQSAPVTVQNNRVMSAPATSNRTSNAGECSSSNSCSSSSSSCSSCGCCSSSCSGKCSLVVFLDVVVFLLVVVVARGIATGDLWYIYPKISPSKLLWGKNDAKMVIEHEY